VKRSLVDASLQSFLLPYDILSEKGLSPETLGLAAAVNIIGFSSLVVNITTGLLR
jgi:hypothetical protein